MKQTHQRTWFSDALFETAEGLCLETRVYWRCSLSEEEKKRRIGSRDDRDGSRLSINVL